MLGASRTVKCQLQGKAASSSCVGPRLAARRSHKASRNFADRRRALVTVAAAAESDAAPVAQQKAAPAAKRALSSIQANEIVEGVVTSIQSFGAFVDIGAEASGLIHVSQLQDGGFVKNVGDVIKMGEVVKVKVLSVDVAGKRLALSRKGLSPRPAAAAAGPVEDDQDALEEAEAVDPNSALEDGLAFVVEDAEGDDEELDPAEIEFVEDIPAEVAREIAIASEDLVTGTVTAVTDSGVTVSYTLSDGSAVEGVIAAEELLAPAYLVADAGDQEEGEEYVEVANINPAQYYKVGDSISCAVYDVEAGGKPLLTQRLPEEADDELAELAAEMEQFENVDDISDALLIQGLWAAEEAVDEDGELTENADVLLEELAPLQGVSAAAAADEAEEEVSTFRSVDPDELRVEVLMARGAAATAPSKLMGGVALNLPSRAITLDPTDQVTGALLEEYGNSQVDYDDADEDEFIGVSVSNTSYIPRRLLKKLGYKIVKDEESGEWEVTEREGADQIEISDSLAAELEALAAGTAVDRRDIDAIVRDIMTPDEDFEEAELPVFARRNPVVAAAAVSAAISAGEVKALRQKTGAGMMDCKKALAECEGDAEKAVEWLRQKGLSGADKKAGRVAAEGAVVQYIHPGSRLGVLLEVNCETDFVAAGEAFTGLANELAMVVASSDVVCVSVEDMPGDLLAKEREVEMGKEDLKSKPEAVRAKIVEGRLDKIKKQYALLEQPALRDNNKTVGELIKETIAATGENIQVRRFIKYNLGEGLEKRSNDFAAEVAQQTQKKDAPAAPAAKEQAKQPEPAAAAKPAVQVSAGQVKQLRDKSGAGMMDCKKALAECNGDVEAASEWLRKKGLASADKKAGRLAAEGAVVQYIHPGSRLGVLLEVNCETDFVAAGEVFNKLANTLAMQIAASTVEYVNPDEIPAEVFEREKEIEMGREDLQSKPEAIRAKIAEGRVKKLVQERVLLEQPYLLDQNKTVAEAVKEAVAACGENVQIRRFVRFQLGEGIEKKESNLAAEVAAATGKA